MINHHLTPGLLGLILLVPGVASAADEISGCSDGDRDVEVVYQQPPYYPHSALLFCVSGQVKTQFTIDKHGETKDIRVLESEPKGIFDEAAASTIKTWRFTPACRDGELADREAIQTIEFRLPGDYGRDCAKTAEQVDEATARLLADIGARYALLAQYWRTGGDWSKVKSSISAPFDDFQGDLEHVASFHRNALKTIPATGRGNRINEAYSRLFSALQPHALRHDDSIETAREWMDHYRLAIDERIDQSRESYEALAADYTRLKRETKLENDVLELLVVPFVGNPEIPFEEAIEPTRRVLDHFEAVVEFLESRRDQWQVTNDALTFRQDSAEETWNALWDELNEHQDSMQSQQRAMLRSFQDYSD